MTKNKTWITSKEAAEILDTTPDKVNYYGRKGYFGARRWTGKEWRYYRKLVERMRHEWKRMGLHLVKGERR